MASAMKREEMGSLWKRETGPIAKGGRSAPVDQLPEFLAGLEVRNFFGGHEHPRSRLRVPAGAAIPPPDPEAAEAPQFGLVALLESVDAGGEHGFHDDLRVLAGEVGDARDLIHQLRLGHGALLLRALPRSLGSLEGVPESGT